MRVHYPGRCQEDLSLKGLVRGFLGKHCLDAGWGQFFQVLDQCCRKRGVFLLKVESKKTSQICPNCLVETVDILPALKVRGFQELLLGFPLSATRLT